MALQKKAFENIVGKGENADNQAITLELLNLELCSKGLLVTLYRTTKM